MNTGIYTITNAATGKVYIGSAVSFLRRWNSHRAELRGDRHGNRYLQRAWRKYGENAFTFRPILYCGREFLLLWEQFAIDGLKAEIGWDNLYNITPFAGSPQTYECSPETRAKLSTASTGRKFTLEARAKIGAANRIRKVTPESRAKASAALKGRIFSPEHRARLSIAGTRRIVSEETKAKIGAANTGRGHTPESRARMSADRKGRKGHPLSPEARARISAANKGRRTFGYRHTPEARAKMSADRKGKTPSPETQVKMMRGRARFYQQRAANSIGCIK